MCGIAGLISASSDEAAVAAMTDRIVHRGPDGWGCWVDRNAGVALGHRRLAIIDLSPAGHQPMVSSDGRWVLSFNGEIYNHAEIRAELEQAEAGPPGNGLPWRGHSDTETLVEGIASWGLEGTLARAVGMFALALWDRATRTLHLVRDRFGEKPLYYGWAAGHFCFASELKAIRCLPGFDNPVSREAVALFAQRTYVPAPLSIYRRLFKLPPGCILSVGAEAWRTPLDSPLAVGNAAEGLRLTRYWSHKAVVAAGLRDPIEDEGEALFGLDEALSRAIRGQSVADVPVGAFLSGGIDSSTVVALYQRHSGRPVRTYTIGFREAGYDEAADARRVAAHLGAEHHEHYVSVEEARGVIPLLPTMYDEPFADSSQIPTHLVSRFARRDVTVALSGDGGDELFGGYNRYFGTARLWRDMRRLPAPLRRIAGNGLGAVPPAVWNKLLRLAPGGRRGPKWGAKIQKRLRVMAGASTLDDVFRSFLDEYAGEANPVLRADAPGPCAFDLDIGVPAGDATRMMYCDALSYLPDDILCKVDRAAMAVSLETRIPFLDHRVAEVAARIPERMKIGGGRGKRILRTLLGRHLPPELFERPKAGFAIPVGEWIRGPLRPWAEDLLDPRQLRDGGMFDPAPVQRRWRQHLSGERDSSFALWAVLMFEAWRREVVRA